MLSICGKNDLKRFRVTEFHHDLTAYTTGRCIFRKDTAFASYFLNEAELYELIKLHGIEKILFATDFPWSTPDAETKLIESTPLTDDEKRAIYYYNAAELLNLE